MDKLDRFIRRYYFNMLIKGGLLFGASLLLLFLIFTTLEYFGYFGTNTRFLLFYGFLGFNGFVFIRYVLIPFLGLLKIGKRINAEDAGRIIGKFFHKEIRDKITNTLQLKNYLDKNPDNAGLIMAGIDQKASGSLMIPFQSAINLKGNLRFLPFFLVPFVFVAGFFLWSPDFLLEPAGRIVKYDTFFEKPAPFTFKMVSSEQAFRNENLNIVMESEGNILPSDVEIQYNGETYRMDTREKGVFTHTARNLQESFQFYVRSSGFRFGPFPVDVLQKPTFSHFNIKVDYPAYTGISDDKYSNIGDINVAEGSRISWEFNTLGSGNVQVFIKNKEKEVKEKREGVFAFDYDAFESFSYSVYAYNEEVGKGDSLQYFVQVKPDAYPRIEVEEHRDSVLLAHLFYRGTIQDDYGFSGLEFRYRIVDEHTYEEEGEGFLTENLDFDPSLKNQVFHHHFDLKSIYIQPGETVEYYFVVYDNDAINGPKSTRSRIFSYYVPSEEELMAQSRKDQERVKEELSQGVGESRQARDDIEGLKRELIDSERIGWEQRESLKNLLDRQQEIQDNFEELKQFKKESEIRQEQFKETNERIKQKQEELEKLFEEVLSDELKDLFNQIRDELDKLDRDSMYEMLEKMDFEFRDLELRMDRALELFRQLELERILQDGIDQLGNLEEEQGSISEETEEGVDSEELAGKQEELKEKFEMVKDLMEEFREKNENLSRPFQIDDTSHMEDSILDDLQNALDQLNMDQLMESLPFQQDSRDKMGELGQMLEGMQQNMFQDKLAEDARALRQILENLLKSSFSQEDLMKETRGINANDPRYVELVQDQRKIKDDLMMIEDSLVALSKRQIQIQSFVNREIAEINLNLDEALDMMVNRRRFNAASRQQFVMTHINNLALLLNESLQNMQNQMAMAQGLGMPDDADGDGMPSFQNMREMQEELNQMLESIQQGHEPMPGDYMDGMSMSEQMARMAAEQEAIRNKLNELAEEMRSHGEERASDLDQLRRDMERSELDMLRKDISRQTIQRQERILTRLLEHERAEKERERDERREGTYAKDYEISNPEEIFEYNRVRNRELEMLRSLPPGLKPYYRSLVETYFLNVD